MSIFVLQNLFLGGIKMGAWINSADLNKLGGPYRKLGLAHELKFDVWTGP